MTGLVKGKAERRFHGLEQYTSQMQALCHLHQTRSHRDIKLANVMVSGWQGNGKLQLKIIDWGSSRLHTGMHVHDDVSAAC